jgi:hypothetical protein
LTSADLITAEQHEPAQVTVTCGPLALTYKFPDGADDGFANAWERAGSFALTIAGEPPAVPALRLLADAKRITRATLLAGDELGFALMLAEGQQ